MANSGFELMPNEKMVLFSHPHWWYFWKQVLAVIGVILLFLLSTVFDGTLQDIIRWIAVIALVIWIVDVIYEFVQWRTTKFAVTDQRVAYTSGFFRRTGVSIPINRVNNVNFEQSLIARLTKNGIVTIESAGEGDSVFENIPNPDHVRTVIFAQMDADEVADSHRDAQAIAQAIRDNPAAAAPTPKSVQERLAELEQLKATGVISDEEYAQKRDDILGSL